MKRITILFTIVFIALMSCNRMPEDLTPPVITLSSPTNGQMIFPETTFRGRVTDDSAGVSAVISVGGASPSALTLDGSGYFNYSTVLPLSENLNVTFTALDTAGNEANETYTYEVSYKDFEDPVINWTGPSGTNVATNVIFSGTITDNFRVENSTIQIGDGSPQALSLNSSGTFSFATILPDTNSIQIVISASDPSNHITALSNDYHVWIPNQSVWNVSVTLNGTGWNTSATEPLTVIIAPRTNDAFDFGSDYWEMSMTNIATNPGLTLIHSFSNVATNGIVGGTGVWSMVVFKDANNDGTMDITNEFPYSFEEYNIDGYSVYDSVFDLYRASGTMTMPASQVGDTYAVMATTSTNSNTAEFAGMGGGIISGGTGTNLSYSMVFNQTGTFYIMGTVDANGNGEFVEANSDYMGFYHDPPSLFYFAPPASANATITSGGANDGFDFKIGLVPEVF